ncbi:CcdB family protein [Polaromonas sp.]|uniref:CcdB family protein n=1 Tax=Polaromonas sp. TaxID=1869339 RepID=UPI00356329B9
MAQFDVHRNQGQMRTSIPFVVVVQSSLFDRYRRRVVAPLVLRQEIRGQEAGAGSRANPVFHIEGVELVLNPLEIVSVSLDQLGPHVGSLADQGQAVSDALDELLTRSWG